MTTYFDHEINFEEDLTGRFLEEFKAGLGYANSLMKQEEDWDPEGESAKNYDEILKAISQLQQFETERKIGGNQDEVSKNKDEIVESQENWEGGEEEEKYPIENKQDDDIENMSAKSIEENKDKNISK